ncbi:MAG: peptidyl-prolyl cis-trans isomerase, partial [Planctomycetota bacterium]|nr:peptidyl-prolyl cis-trans isomerase [Planctomycetota bacterium]
MCIRDRYKANVVWLEVAVRKLIKERLAISEADVFNYYWMNRSQYTEPEMVRARHILINPAQYAPSQDGMRAVGQAEWAKALEKALEEQNRLRSGLDFAEAARRFSHDRQTAERGGDLGFFSRPAMVKPFSDAVFALKDGQVSEPVKTIYGYHLIKVEERRPEHLIPFDQIQEKVRRDYEDYLVMSQAADLLAQLRQEATASGRLQILEKGLAPTAQ